MTIHLFTTTDLSGEREATFNRLIESIARSEASGMDLRVHVLFQNCSAEVVAARLARLPVQSRLCVMPGRMSISGARNHLMAAALAEAPFGEDDIVAFPDDDCWYPDGLLAQLKNAFHERSRLDLLLCRVSLEPDDASDVLKAMTPAKAATVVRLTMSNSLFVRGRLATALGAFDPALGLGTPARGGEDTDYGVRAFLAGRETVFVDRALVGHPVADRKAAIRYFRGATIVLARHARHKPALMREFLRKLLVGVYFVGQGRLSARDFLGILRESAGSFRTSFVSGRRNSPVLSDGLSRPLAS